MDKINMFKDKINMSSEELLFAAPLQIQEPLYVEKVEFLKDEGELHMYVDFRKGARFRSLYVVQRACLSMIQ